MGLPWNRDVVGRAINRSSGLSLPKTKSGCLRKLGKRELDIREGVFGNVGVRAEAGNGAGAFPFPASGAQVQRLWRHRGEEDQPRQAAWRV